jgi:hypothetical protein
MFFGAGLLSLPLLGLGICAGLRRWPGHWQVLRDPRVWLGLGIAAWSLLYPLLMIPKLGPVMDVDLFFGAYLGLAFLAGHLLDRMPSMQPGDQRRGWLLAAVLGNACVTASLLGVHGIHLPG